MLKTEDYKSNLNKDIESGIKGYLESELQGAISDKNFRTKLRKKLDGSIEHHGEKTDAEDMDKALQNIQKRSEEFFAKLPDAALQPLTELKIREITANEYANAISASVTEWLNDVVVPAFSDVTAKVFADVLSKVVSNRTEEYIRTAEIYQWNPPGSILLKPGYTIDGPGGIPVVLNATALPLPNPVPLEYILSPENVWPESLANLRVTKSMPGGIK
jgi:hypothetical protein